MGEYIDGMLITFPDCHGAVSRANRLDERIMSQSDVDSLESSSDHASWIVTQTHAQSSTQIQMPSCIRMADKDSGPYLGKIPGL